VKNGREWEMKNRPSSHFILLILICVAISAGYVAVHAAATLRGYETSVTRALRDLSMFMPILLLFIWLRLKRFSGNWSLFTAAVLLFSIGMLVQYRLYSDPEYGARRKAAARAERLEKIQSVLRRHIEETYSPEKKAAAGLPVAWPTPSAGGGDACPAEETFSLFDALTSFYTWLSLFSLAGCAAAFHICSRRDFGSRLRRLSIITVLVTFVMMLITAIASLLAGGAGKAPGGTTPWEIFKIPFLLGFAGVLEYAFRDLKRTRWAMPAARHALPLAVVAVMPFVSFLVLADFGQMLVFGGAYVTLYFVAVRRLPQLLLSVGSFVLVAGVLVAGALPQDTQSKVPTLTAIAGVVESAIPDRIQQRLHLWIDGFNPPPPGTAWWKKYYDDALEKNPTMKELAAQGPEMEKRVNADVWFDRLAFQPAQATFGIMSGGTTGTGLGLGYPEIIPIADSDYVYSALSEETGLIGGAAVLLSLLAFVVAGVRVSVDARDMFTKLCAAGITAFIGLQGLVNIGGNTGALPMTGITLPFVSHGGASLVTSFIMLGMLLGISQRNTGNQTATEETPIRQSGRPVAPPALT
jgi:cell division protein FtsW (lipid II flippase)